MKAYRIVFFSIFSVLSVQSFAQCPDQILATVTSCGTVEASVNNFGNSGNIVWNWGDDSETMLLNNVTHNYNSAGVYTICAEGSAPGCAEFLLCTDIVVASCADSCELDVEYVLMEDSMLFYPFNYPANASIFWTLNGDEAGSGEQFALNSETPGLYEICAIYETPECPSGVEWCYTMFVSDPDACPGEDDIVGINSDLNCAAWIFNIENFTDGSNVIWDFGDGTTTVSGDSIVDHLYTENGLYEVEITYVGQNCTSFLIYELEVDCLEPNPCDLDMEVVYENDTLELYPYNFPEDAVLFWTLNGESIQTGDSLIMNLSEPGVYEICAAYETPACPNAVFWCETWAVQGEEDCPGEDDLFAGPSGDDCGDWVFEIGSFVPGTTVIWNFGDGNIEVGGHFVEHTFTENGEYEVWAIYNNLLCSDSISLGTVVVDCFNECELDVEYGQDGDTAYFHAFNFPEGATIFWTLDGLDGGQGDDFVIDVSEPGLYEICAMYETPECPQGVFWCYTWFTEGSSDCSLSLSYTSWVMGVYEFTAEGWPENGIIEWHFGDGTSSEGPWQISHIYEPGVYTVCAVLTDDVCETPIESCVEIEVTDVECGWDNFVLINNYPAVPMAFEWVLQNSNNDIAGEGSGTVDSTGTSYTGEACVAAGCYTLTLTSDEMFSLDQFDLEFLFSNPEVPVTVEWYMGFNPYILYAEISIQGGCETIGIQEETSSLQSLKVFPVPSSGTLNISLTDDQPIEWRLFDGVGRLVEDGTMIGQKNISLRHLPAGTFVLHVQQYDEIRTFSIPLLN